MRSTDPELVEGFEAFYERNYRPLVGLAYALSGRRDRAEDLAQDALEAAFKSWDRVSRLDDPAAWVRRVVSNRSVSWYRRRRAETQAPVDPAHPVSQDSAHTADLWRLVRQLPGKQAIAVTLRYLEDLKLADIASVMGCSVSTANTHLRRAHQKLATELGAEWKEDW